MKALARQRGSCSPDSAYQPRMDIGRALLLAMLRIYKNWISPALPAACRYVPTCSEYAMEAVEEHGALRGSWLALRRVARCHPFGGHGADPVPPREEFQCCSRSAQDSNSPTSAKGRTCQPGTRQTMALRQAAPRQIWGTSQTLGTEHSEFHTGY